MIVTLAQLKRLGACQSNVDAFERLFGKEVKVTEALCVEHFATFDWDWAARHLLPKDKLAEYQRVQAAASAEFQRVEAAAFGKYLRVQAAAFGKLAEGCK
jgi:hypothetical protein